jgi:cytochrome c-type biogenesis protein CcmF
MYATLMQLPKVLSRPSRWGYWLAHVGVGVTALGIVLSVSLESEKSLRLKPGQETLAGGYQVTLEKLVSVKGSNYEGIRAYFDIKKHDKTVSRLTPEKRYYKARDLVTTESSLGLYRWTDFYIALGEPLGDDQWSLRFYTKPFVRLIWLGGIMMALGMLSKVFMLRKRNQSVQSIKTVQEISWKL